MQIIRHRKHGVVLFRRFLASSCAQQLSMKSPAEFQELSSSTNIAPNDIKQHLISSSNTNTRQKWSNTFQETLHLNSNVSKSSLFLAGQSEHGLLRRIFEYIETVSHMNEVRLAQTRVLKIKKLLGDAGDNKRTILRDLEKIRNNLNHVYKDMKLTNNRASDGYLNLVKMEVELYMKEKHLQETFLKEDEKEQYLFSSFSTAINDSYEKEKLHTNFIKVFGIIGTILASFLTLIASFVAQVFHQNKFYTLRQDVESTVTTEVISRLDELNKRLFYIETNAANKYQKPESWGLYLNRHTRWMYSWILPKSK